MSKETSYLHELDFIQGELNRENNSDNSIKKEFLFILEILILKILNKKQINKPFLKDIYKKSKDKYFDLFD